MAGWSQTNANRRERLRQLALEQIDLDKDPYIFKNHWGLFECKLCLTSHVTDGSYLSHTQGRKHQMNLARREAKEREHRKNEIDLSTDINNNNNNNGTQQGGSIIGGIDSNGAPIHVKKNLLKIGRPGYKITKIKDPVTRQLGLMFQLEYPEIGLDITPRYRFMSAFEQKIDLPHDRKFQYLVIAADPYESCAFKIDAKEIDQRPGRFWTHFDKDTKDYYIQFFFRNSTAPNTTTTSTNNHMNSSNFTGHGTKFNNNNKAPSSLPPPPVFNRT